MTALTKLGKYELKRELGKGAMGVVYEGFDPFIERTVAIKTVLKSMLDSSEAQDMLNRFRREAQAAGRLTHPNIVSIYEYGEDQDVAFIAMEFIQGKELKSYFDTDERFQMKEVVRIMSQLLDALEYSHNRGVVHRDIKPANIILTEDTQVKVADFGIARIESSNLTTVGTVLGTPTHMSPEQFMGLAVDRRTDIYSSGVILYQFLTGERPFTGSVITIMHKALNQEPVPPSALNFSVTAAVDSVVKKAMAKRLEDRYQTAREFMEALKVAAEGGSAAAAAEIDPEATYVSLGANILAQESAAHNTSPGQGGSSTSSDLELWKNIKNSQHLEDYQHYLEVYPDSKFAELARLRITALESSAKAEAEAEAEAEARAAAEARAKAEAEAQRRKEEEERARREREAAEAKAKAEAEARRKREEEEKARREKEAAEARARAEAEARRKQEQEEIARREREAAEAKARAEAEARRKMEAEENARREQEAAAARAIAEAEARHKKELEDNARREREAAEARAKAETEARRKKEAEEKALRDSEAAAAKAKTDAEARLKKESEDKARRERDAAEAKAKAEAELQRKNEQKVQREQEAAAKKSKSEAESKAKLEAEAQRKNSQARQAQDPDQTMVATAAQPPKKSAPILPIAGGVLAVLVGAGIWFATRPSSDSTHAPDAATTQPQVPAVAVESPAAKVSPSVAKGNLEQEKQADSKRKENSDAAIAAKAKADSDKIAAAKAKAEAEAAVANAKTGAEKEKAAKAKAEADAAVAKAKADADAAAAAKAKADAEAAAAVKARAEAEAAAAAAKAKADADAAAAAAKAKTDSANAAKAAAEARAKVDAEAAAAKAKSDAEATAIKAKVDAPALYQQGVKQEDSGEVNAAVKSYLAAANAGYGPAMKKLGDIYGKGSGDVPRDYAASIKWYKKAKESGVTLDSGLKR
jgi:serine/threonine-protein kinase